MVEYTEEEKAERLYQSHKGTITTTPSAFVNPIDLSLIPGCDESEWHRLVKECGLDEENFYGCEGFPEKAEKKVVNSKREIQLPGVGVLVSEFAQESVDLIKDQNILFYRQDSGQVVEIGEIEDDSGDVGRTCFRQIKPSRFITLVERFFLPWSWCYKRSGEKFKGYKSMTKDAAGTVIDSHIMEYELPNINRILTIPSPIIYNGKLTFPECGYDPRFKSWLNHDAPKIENRDMDIKEAKEIIHYMFKEFCFQSKQDYTNAVAGLLTPFLRGLYKTRTNRTPMFFYEANRERAGKDFLASLTSFLYEGMKIEDPPISTGEQSGNSNEELRKKLVSGILMGKTRFHFGNNKGFMNNATLEYILTAPTISDRLLGKNAMVTLMNELEFSGSGNTGIKLTADLANRTIFIKQFLDIEDANSRKFENPHLDLWVLENREKVLSALYSLVKNWFDKGQPKGSIPFASFPEWAEICGGIMEAAGFDNPCVYDKGLLGISADAETEEMKSLFEYCFETNPDYWMKKKDIVTLIKMSEDPFFAYLDFDKMPDQVKFAKKFEKFVGRILSDIRLSVENPLLKRAADRKYKFSKEKADFNLKDVFGSNINEN